MCCSFAGFISDELSFVRLSCSFKSRQMYHTNRTFSRYGLLLVHLIFIALLITDITLTAMYTERIFPFYTIHLVNDKAFAFLGTNSFLAMIFFCAAMIAGFITCISCFVGFLACIGFIAGELSSGTNSLNGLACLYSLMLTFMIPAIIMAFISIPILILCLSPALLLYCLLLLFARMNSVSFTIGKALVSDWRNPEYSPLLKDTFTMNRIIGSIANNKHLNEFEGLTAIHIIISKLLLIYILAFAMSDEETNRKLSDSTTTTLLTIFNMDTKSCIDYCLDLLKNNKSILSILDVNEQTILECKQNQQIQSNRLTHSLLGYRINFYIVFCLINYLLLTIIFFVIYEKTDYFVINSSLSIFYYASYFMYYILFFMNVYFSMKRVKLFMNDICYWYLFVQVMGNNRRNYEAIKLQAEIKEHNFFLLYDCIINAYYTKETLNQILSDHKWMCQIIVTYAVGFDVDTDILTTNILATNVEKEKQQLKLNDSEINNEWLQKIIHHTYYFNHNQFRQSNEDILKQIQSRGEELYDVISKNVVLNIYN